MPKQGMEQVSEVTE